MKEVTIKMLLTQDEFPEVTDTTTTSPHKLEVYPDYYQTEITGDWYQTETLPVKALKEINRVDVSLAYREILEDDPNSDRLFQFSTDPDLIWKGEI